MVLNQKGGVGKMIIVVNIGLVLVVLGVKVLVIDFDLQGNVFIVFGVLYSVEVFSVYDVLIDEMFFVDVVQLSLENLNFFCVLSIIYFVGVEIEFVVQVV